ncbi:hypothetical protein J1N35_028348 [Gossypium stocksii]|uniref:Reverse transcriptase domain-containing protein n=1 Tax=Gossypium stocksii TaxID=47602 RepID=A0A9D3UVR1_9ROSI|nr:hypothetical protein J1N35_028348 [Gossypium stocksii]
MSRTFQRPEAEYTRIDRGHKTNNCSSLKNAIEEAIRNDELKDFMAQDATPPRQSDEEENDPMVMSASIIGFKVNISLVDSDSVIEILARDAYHKMMLKEQALRKANPLYGFVNHRSGVKGYITLPITLGDDEHSITKYV